MDLHVDVSRPFLLVALSTDTATVGFLPAVRQQVFLQVIFGDKGLPAEATAERTIFLMEPDVGLQVAFSAEALVAEAAVEWLLTRVGQHVGIKSSHLPEGFPTDTAKEWFLTSVDPLVDLQDLG